MNNYNGRKIFSNLEKKPDMNDMLKIKKSRAEKIFAFDPSGENNNIITNDKYMNNVNRNIDVGNEKMYSYNMKDINKKHLLKNDTYNNNNDFNNNDFNKQIYYDKHNGNEKNYMKIKNMNDNKNNYVDKNYFDENNIIKDRSKFRRLETFNENDKINNACAYNDVNDNINDNTNNNINNNTNNNNNNNNNQNSNIQQNYNEYKITNNNVEAYPNNVKLNYEYNKKNNENYHSYDNYEKYKNFNQRNVGYTKNNEPNMNFKYSRINRINGNYISPTDSRSIMISKKMSSTFHMRDKMNAPVAYDLNDNEDNMNNINNMNTLNSNNNNNNSGIIKDDTNKSINNNIANVDLLKNDSVTKDSLNNDEFLENNMEKHDMALNTNNEFGRNKNMNKKNMMMNQNNLYIPHDKQIGSVVKYIVDDKNTNMDEEKISSNHMMKYHNYVNHNKERANITNNNNMNNNMNNNNNVADNEGNRKKEYHNFSLSTIDSTYSNQNNLEKKFGSKFIDPHHHNVRKEAVMDAPSQNNIDYMDEKKKLVHIEKIENKYNMMTNDTNNSDIKNNDTKKIKNNNNINNSSIAGGVMGIDKNNGNLVAMEYAHLSEYEYENAIKKNYKQSFKKDHMIHMDKHRYIDKGDVGVVMSKNYEYNKKEGTKKIMPQEYVNDINDNIHITNNIPYGIRKEILINDNNNNNNNNNNNKLQQDKIIINNMMRDNKGNMNKNLPHFGSSPKYDESQLRRQAIKNADKMDMNYKNKNTINYDNNDMMVIKYNNSNEEVHGMYQLDEAYENNNLYDNMKGDVNMDKQYIMRNEKNLYNKKVNFKFMNDRNMKRACHENLINPLKEGYKNNDYSAYAYKNYPSELYSNMDNTPERHEAYDAYRGDLYLNAQYSDMEKHEDMRNYQNGYPYDTQNEKGALTIIRLPAENKKQVKKKKKKSVEDSRKSLVDMYSSAIPISDNVDPNVLKALSKNENLDEKVYALIPKSVVEINEFDEITHVTLKSPSPLFVNQNMNVKQHIVTTNYYKHEDIPNIASCVVPLSDESLKESLEKSKESLSGGENDKNLKSIIRGNSLRNKNGSSLSVKFRLSDNEEKNMQTEKDDSVEKMKELNKKIEEHILSDELKNLKIDRDVTERKRASIFDDSKAKPRNEKKNETNNKIVLDSNKVKKATEIKLKKIQHVTGLLEKYDIPNPFEKYYKDSIDYSQLMGQNNNAKLLNLALTVSNNYYKFIVKSLERAEIKEVFNEKRKKMMLKLIALLGNQINNEIKKKFFEANAMEPSKEEELKKEYDVKSKMSDKEKEIKIEEHNLICQYWEKQSECMSMLIDEWNKISDILESINIDPNNIMSSLLSLYGEKTVNDFHLSLEEIKKANVELNVNTDDITIPEINDAEINKFDPSNMTILNLIEDINWDMDLEYSINQIREDWKNENKQNKKIIQKKIIEGIKHRIGLLDYLNKVEINLNAFAKIIEGRMISNDDVKSQLLSMQDMSEEGLLSKLLENLKCNKMDINAESFKTPTSFFVSHHLPMTVCSYSDNSNIDELKDMNETNSNGDIKDDEKKIPDENDAIDNENKNEEKD
ncbi:hypothetical protein PGSY75_0529400 [Plasmodium gaboni]|uniref:Uncharacterized protein n=1 Tax=Plasmodium gaboni TaxID=647221 RepID=A0A151LTI4_9APIC|nr:hypothetical protein PGSY75_0529400 [Plasmodium gaboni]KYO02488.1 hypothetical protein PGSY75_0529400 [Plasmodium gaboni]